MLRLKKITLTIFIGAILISCSAPKSTSIIYGDNYNKTNNLTTITIFPYGVIKVPGKWTKTRESTVSHQHFFIGPDSVTFAVALNSWDNYEFYNHQITPDTFVKTFYEWDANYLKEKTNGKVRIVKEDKARNFIIWNLTSAPEVNDYFLFGLKGKIAYNLYIGSDNWDETKQVEMLEKIYCE
jgi:hypothetical protein